MRSKPLHRVGKSGKIYEPHNDWVNCGCGVCSRITQGCAGGVKKDLPKDDYPYTVVYEPKR